MMSDFEYAKIIKQIKSTPMTDEERQLVYDTVEEEKKAERMTEEQYLGIKSALDKAQDTDIPFPVINDDELAVVGDANRTELRKFEYEITFRKPAFDADGNLSEEVENKKYENVFVKPRMNTRIVKLLASLLPYFYKVDEDGNQVEYTKLELIQIFGQLDESILDLMYELVAMVLEIPAGDIDYMEGSTVIATIMKFLEDNPNTVREAQLFFS